MGIDKNIVYLVTGGTLVVHDILRDSVHNHDSIGMFMIVRCNASFIMFQYTLDKFLQNNV